MVGGDLVVLNGASSSGKTTIAQLLQDRLCGRWMHVSFDHFASMLPRRFALTGEENWARVAPEWGEVLPMLLPGFARAVAALADAGNDLIVDHVLLGEHNARQFADAVAGRSVLSVGVECPLEELERREAERGDRPPGLVAYQHEHVHVPGRYDLRVDSGSHTPESCVETIVRAYERTKLLASSSV